MPFMGALIGGGLGLLGSSMASSSAESAAKRQANAQLEAARIAAEESRFRPVAITTGFGKSQFTTDPEGRVTGAGYELTPELQALRNQLMQQAQQQGLGLTQQGLGAAQGLFGLGQQFLPTSTSYAASPEAMGYVQMLREQAAKAAPSGFSATASPEAQRLFNQLSGISEQVMPTSYDPMVASQRYIQQQQELLRTEREQALSGIMNRLAQTGTQGLGVSQAGGGAANPLMQAFANAQAQQDRAITAEADRVSRANLQGDIELASRLGQTGLQTLTQSQQQALQNALELGRFSAGQAGLGLTAQQQAEELARQRMLSGLQTGTGLFSDALKIAQGGYGPLSTQLAQAQGIEQLGQGALDLGTAIGQKITTANTNAGNMLASGAANAAQTLGQVQGYNPLATSLMGLSQNQAFTQGLAGLFNPYNPAAWSNPAGSAGYYPSGGSAFDVGNMS